ncbi:lipid kinase [Rhodopseudomonas boonkerdii]|uniref:putative urea ABC transporter substrate-binding protein n=1 Tax=Rhodopseudomonas boonkerdii TaxID=475937 RepID=UPI001E4439C4|nr:putative urea ABC transporter substrate-binding protein [Rhodopseudomonas boonkerdii]UGV25264.1 lipid kinase [Rhodopseudomonas boonkerdii]
MTQAARLLLAIAIVLLPHHSASAQGPKKEFKVAWIVYVGFMPWPYAVESGIAAKWSDKYGIKIDFTQVNDYAEALNQYTATRYDAVTATNMDALTVPSGNGLDTTALIVGDLSNGNDAVVLKSGSGVTDIKGLRVNLVELSVSHYLLARALEKNGLSERDVTVVNTSDADIASAFHSGESRAVVTWNPQLADVKAVRGAKVVFDSSQIPGEIIDGLFANTEVLRDNPAFGKALAGIWYDVMTNVLDKGDVGQRAREDMARLSGTTAAEIERQLATTRMFGSAQDAVAFVRSPELVTTMDRVRSFAFDKGLLGEKAADKDVVGISFDGGTVLGNPKNVKLRFDASYALMAAEGRLKD